jgi:hypothetical protein
VVVETCPQDSFGTTLDIFYSHRFDTDAPIAETMMAGVPAVSRAARGGSLEASHLEENVLQHVRSLNADELEAIDKDAVDAGINLWAGATEE